MLKTNFVVILCAKRAWVLFCDLYCENQVHTLRLLSWTFRSSLYPSPPQPPQPTSGPATCSPILMNWKLYERYCSCNAECASPVPARIHCFTAIDTLNKGKGRMCALLWTMLFTLCPFTKAVMLDSLGLDFASGIFRQKSAWKSTSESVSNLLAISLALLYDPIDTMK